MIADYGSFQLFDLDRLDMVAASGAVEIRDDYNVIMLNAGWLDTTRMPAVSGPAPQRPSPGRRLFLLQFVGPVKPEWYRAVLRTGVNVVTYVPSNAYLLYGEAASLYRLERLAASAAFVQWAGPYLDDYKVHPAARPFDAYGNPRVLGTDLVEIQSVADPEANAATFDLLDNLGLRSLIVHKSEALGYVNIVVPMRPEIIPEIAARPDVVSIQPYYMPQKLDERQDQIMAGNLAGNAPAGPGYLAWLGGRGFTQAQFTASGFAVDVSDSGIDNGTTTPNHFGLYVQGNTASASRVVYNRLEGTPNGGSTIQGCDGHGTLNSHIVSGYNDLAGFPHADAAGFRYGLGTCPFVRVGSSVIFDPNTFTFPDYEDLQSRAYRDGARISTNSWGANVGGAYNSDAQRYDALVRDAQPAGSAVANPGNQEMVIVFSAGNAGSAANTIGSPGTAKNVLTVGAGENVHSHSTANGGNSAAGNDGCFAGAGCCNDTQADSANDIIFFSSRGPCDDQRKKPDIVAPGTHVTGGVAQDAPPPSPAGTGNDLACFAASGVCALPGGGVVGDPDNFFPAGQQFYTTSSGTSHSTPAVAGGAALLRQFFVNGGLNPPSPAMTKAYLMNAARYMTGTGANDTLWSNSQGMGAADLGRSFDGTPRISSDEVSAQKLTASGQTRTFTGIVSTAAQPFRVTLAWTDAPGSTTGNAFNNDLDLTVTVGGNTYLGNVFSGANSVTGGAADPRNNVENVFLPAGTTGTFVVTVTAANINSDGVPGDADPLDQDFALVIYNAVEAADLAVTKSDLPDPVVTGSNLTYAINVTNSGPSVAATALLTDAIPAGTTFQSLTSPAGWVCVTPPVGGTGTVNCTKASVAAGESAAFGLVVKAGCALADGTIISNTVTVSSITLDPNPANNSATTTTTVSNPPPLITCPANVVVPNDPGKCSAVVSYPPPGVTDNCPGVAVSCAPPSGATFPVGQTTVGCTATDSGGAASTCSFHVTVNDVEPPAVSCAVATPLLWPPNHNLVNVGLTATAVDICSGPLPVTVGVSGDEDDETPTGDGRFSPDAKSPGSGTLRLRSERIGNSDGRVYLIVPEAVDQSGNTGFTCCAVVVPHSQSAAAIASVNAQAAAATAFCQSHAGAAPAGYFVIGDGPVIGPKQ
ncbi:MAG TPA: S8 family serine peptidase [Gemmatimonadales bacterium]|nr:S8 family serine peptidase [Gemmatimonadales bacterium]